MMLRAQLEDLGLQCFRPRGDLAGKAKPCSLQGSKKSDDLRHRTLLYFFPAQTEMTIWTIVIMLVQVDSTSIQK